jgi:hypothetical protein
MSDSRLGRCWDRLAPYVWRLDLPRQVAYMGTTGKSSEGLLVVAPGFMSIHRPDGVPLKQQSTSSPSNSHPGTHSPSSIP